MTNVLRQWHRRKVSLCFTVGISMPLPKHCTAVPCTAMAFASSPRPHASRCRSDSWPRKIAGASKPAAPLAVLVASRLPLSSSMRTHDHQSERTTVPSGSMSKDFVCKRGVAGGGGWRVAEGQRWGQALEWQARCAKHVMITAAGSSLGIIATRCGCCGKQ